MFRNVWYHWLDLVCSWLSVSSPTTPILTQPMELLLARFWQLYVVLWQLCWQSTLFFQLSLWESEPAAHLYQAGKILATLCFLRGNPLTVSQLTCIKLSNCIQLSITTDSKKNQQTYTKLCLYPAELGY